jgi:hypothetical protein
MSAPDPASDKPILKLSKAKLGLPVPEAMLWLRRTEGTGLLRQIIRMAQLSYSPSRLTPEDYFLYALFRPGLTQDERRAFLSPARSKRLNMRLAPHALPGVQHGLIADKILAGLLFDRMGLPVAPIRAVFSTSRRVPGVRMLTRPEDIARYLAEPGVLPCFGKPAGSSLAIGGASLIELADGGTAIRLGNGQTEPLERLVKEIARNFPGGYMFQELERPAAALEPLTGPTIGTIRVTTLRLRDGPVVLYVVLKLPAAGAMIDSLVAAKPNVFALLDPETGRFLRAQDTMRMCTQTAESSPATGASLSGAAVPGLAPALELALEVHRLLPAHGVLGIDIALTDEGPLLNEVNGNPHHSIYQRAAAKGLLNPEFKPLIDEALAVTETMQAEAGTGRRRFRWLGRRGAGRTP